MDKGKLVSWNNDKGYGFIRPQEGENDIFLHIGALPHYQRRPRKGDRIKYVLDIDHQDRPFASEAKIRGLAWSKFTFFWLLMWLVFGAYLYLAVRRFLPLHPAAIYVGMSLLTIWAYSRDKRAAKSDLWRTSEFRLHLMEFFGGWPGALLAQQFYRHKNRKVPYQIVFWLIVAIHIGGWYYVFTHQGVIKPYTQRFREHVSTIAVRIKQEVQTRQDGIESEPESRQAEENAAETTPSADSGRRSLVTVPKSRHKDAVQGIVKEIRPDEGVIVSFRNSEGLLDKSTLVENFPNRFREGEKIRVLIDKVSIQGTHKQIELLLIEEEE